MNEFESAKKLFSESLVFLTKEDYANAELCLREADRLTPDRVSVLTNLAAALLKQNKVAEARRFSEKAVALDRDNAEGWSNLANCLYFEQDYPRALIFFDRVIALNANLPEVWLNRGNTCRQLARHDEALANYGKAIEIKPDFAEAWFSRGGVYADLQRYDEALFNYDSAISLKVDIAYAAGDRLNVKLHICNWNDIARDFDEVRRKTESGLKASSPFYFLAVPSTPALQGKCAEIYAHDKYPDQGHGHDQAQKRAHERTRIGYFSADFHNHATAQLMAGVFEQHDRAKFEVIAFSFGPSAQDAMRLRLAAAFERFIDVGTRTDAEIAALARNLEVDIAVDLKGFTQDARTGIFARRAAPVQVNYLGYPGTMGAGYIDYLVADPVVIPPEHVQHYAEKIVYLPDSYQVNDSARKISDRVFTRGEANLPAEGFVFCCFNNNYKITPDVFDIWMRLLHQIEGSVLWLLEDNATAARNLRQEATKRGISPTRLVFAGRLDSSSHLARHRVADLFLDTPHYNAHTTASDALWAGLPVVTRLGATFAGRVAAGLLAAAGLPELVAKTAEQYESLALEIAGNPDKLAALRQKLAVNRATCPLFNTSLSARHLETAYNMMWQRYCAGLPPDHIYVEK